MRKRTVIVENTGLSSGAALTTAGLVLAFWAIGVAAGLPGCGTIEGAGKDIQASSTIVRNWLSPAPGTTGNPATPSGKAGGR
jgi:predicted small secreted protein